MRVVGEGASPLVSSQLTNLRVGLIPWLPQESKPAKYYPRPSRSFLTTKPHPGRETKVSEHTTQQKVQTCRKIPKQGISMSETADSQ